MAAYAPVGVSEYTFTINEIHAGAIRRGTLDANQQVILLDTSDLTFIDDQAYYWFLVPNDTAYLYLSAFHLPEEDLPPQQRRCDIAPDESAYTLDVQ